MVNMNTHHGVPVYAWGRAPKGLFTPRQLGDESNIEAHGPIQGYLETESELVPLYRGREADPWSRES